MTVTDDGPGIPAADRERVFHRFTRLDDARARDAGGSGLGLAIVRELVRRHGGRSRSATRSPACGSRCACRARRPGRQAGSAGRPVLGDPRTGSSRRLPDDRNARDREVGAETLERA